MVDELEFLNHIIIPSNFQLSSMPKAILSYFSKTSIQISSCPEKDSLHLVEAIKPSGRAGPKMIKQKYCEPAGFLEEF